MGNCGPKWTFDGAAVKEIEKKMNLKILTGDTGSNGPVPVLFAGHSLIVYFR